MSKSTWERFKVWWNRPTALHMHTMMCIKEDIEGKKRQAYQDLVDEESRLSRQIEQLSVAFDNLPTWGFPEHETILKTMFAELREVQEARRKNNGS